MSGMRHAIDSVALPIAVPAGGLSVVNATGSRCCPRFCPTTSAPGRTGCRRPQRGSSKGLVLGGWATGVVLALSGLGVVRRPTDWVPSMPRPRVGSEPQLGAMVQVGGPRSSRPGAAPPEPARQDEFDVQLPLRGTPAARRTVRQLLPRGTNRDSVWPSTSTLGSCLCWRVCSRWSTTPEIARPPTARDLQRHSEGHTGAMHP